MTDEFRDQLRQILEEEILVHLRTLAVKLDEMSAQIYASSQILEAKLDAIIEEQTALRAELQALRDEEEVPAPASRLVH
jgi:cell division protein FtsB